MASRPAKDVKRSNIISKENSTSQINQRLIEKGKPRVGGATVLAFDIDDIDKSCAKYMDHLVEVRDGSTGGMRSLGYWTLEAMGIGEGSWKTS